MVLAVVAAAVSLVVAVALPRYGCPGGFVLLDPREFPGMSDEAVCIRDSPRYSTPGEVSNRGAIKTATAIAGVIFGTAAVVAFVRGRRGREPDMPAPKQGG
jgi:hypothetical protein